MTVDALTARYSDPAQRWRITKRAMILWLAVTEEKDEYSREDYRVWLDSLPSVVTDTDYAERIETLGMRAHEDHVHNGGDNCDEGTQRFLDTFGVEMPELNTRKYVTVSVTLTFQIDNSADEDDTRHDVERYLRVETDGNVDDMEHGSVNVSIDDVSVSTDY